MHKSSRFEKIGDFVWIYIRVLSIIPTKYDTVKVIFTVYIFSRIYVIRANYAKICTLRKDLQSQYSFSKPESLVKSGPLINTLYRLGK